MSKKVRYTSVKLSTGNSLIMDNYKNISRKKSKALINRIWGNLNKPLIVRSETSIAIPSHGLEIIRTGHRSLVVCRLTGGYSDVSNPTDEQLLDGGFTHFYNDMFDEWVSIKESQDES